MSISGSAAEKELGLLIHIHGLPKPIREFLFHEVRRWRFDFCFPDHMIAVEIEGGSWAQGRHTRGVGFENDCTKYAEALIRGWKVLRVTPKMVRDGRAIEWLKSLLGFSAGNPPDVVKSHRKERKAATVSKRLKNPKQGVAPKGACASRPTSRGRKGQRLSEEEFDAMLDRLGNIGTVRWSRIERTQK